MQLAAQGNVNCRTSVGTPFSYIYWPPERQPRPGTYEVEVWFQNECNDTSPVTFNLYVTFNGRQILHASKSPALDERYLTSFNINADGTTNNNEGGIIRGLDTLDYRSQLSTRDGAGAGTGSSQARSPSRTSSTFTPTMARRTAASRLA